jgi:hypothetical protein
MEIVAILRVLWRRRLLVLLGLAISLAVCFKLATATPAVSGVAWTTAALDTKPSQIVAPTPEGAETLGWRAELLAGLLLTDAARAEIAKAMGVPADQVAVFQPVLNVPESATALPANASEAAIVTAAPYVLTVTSDEQLGTIAIMAAAPERAAAVRLADAVVKKLSADAASPVVTTPVPTATPDPAAEPSLTPPPAPEVAQAFVIERTTAVHSDVVSSGGGRIVAAGTGMVLFALWCGAIALIPRRRPRTPRRSVRPFRSGPAFSRRP